MVKLIINGRATTFSGDPETPLLWVLRDFEKLTGTKYGCGIAQCGACTVHIDGQPQRACVIPIAALEGKQVVTIEGASGREAEAVKAAWRSLDVPQCGYCQSGQIMSAIGLLQKTPQPDDEDIDNAMAGNLCRCATYQRIREAIKNASANIRGARQ